MDYLVFEREELLASRDTDVSGSVDVVFEAGLGCIKLCADVLGQVEEFGVLGACDCDVEFEGSCWDTLVELDNAGWLWAMRKPVAAVCVGSGIHGVYGGSHCVCGFLVGDCIDKDCERGGRAL